VIANPSFQVLGDFLMSGTASLKISNSSFTIFGSVNISRGVTLWLDNTGTVVVQGKVTLYPTSVLKISTGEARDGSTPFLKVNQSVDISGEVKIVDSTSFPIHGSVMKTTVFQSNTIRGQFDAISVDLTDPCSKAINPQGQVNQSNYVVTYEVADDSGSAECLQSAATKPFIPNRAFLILVLGLSLAPLLH